MTGRVKCVRAVRLGVVVALVACGARSPTDVLRQPEGLRFETRMESAASSPFGPGPAVLARLVVTNTADTSQRLLWTPCWTAGPIWLRAYLAGTTRVAWDSNIAYRSRACFLVLKYRDVSPGAKWEYVSTIPVQDILGDTLPSGVYSFTITASQLQPANRAELPAGELTLTR